MISFLLMLTAISASAQSTARKFVLKNSSDGQSELTCYLPKNPSGKAVVDCPGGGYSHLAMDHEGHQWAEYFNKQGIAFFVLKYRMPYGNHRIEKNREIRSYSRLCMGTYGRSKMTTGRKSHNSDILLVYFP